MKVLFAGESWMSYTTHVKGFDSFMTSTYNTGEKWLKKALEDGGFQVDFMPNHIAPEAFPATLDEMMKYDCLILSDIGSNTLLLHNDSFMCSQRSINRCQLIKDYVMEGGALVMVGGYMTFSGIDGKGRWGVTPVQDVLPVILMNGDDRREHPEGVIPSVESGHPALANVSGNWPHILGYNKTAPKKEAEVPVTVDGDPLVAFSSHGKGRSAVFTSDCAPHWAPPEFCEWKSYGALWQGIVNYITARH
jgi:uncharacterized membrane protein